MGTPQPPDHVQRVIKNPHRITPLEILHLQRISGNQATQRVLHARWNGQTPVQRSVQASHPGIIQRTLDPEADAVIKFATSKDQSFPFIEIYIPPHQRTSSDTLYKLKDFSQLLSQDSRINTELQQSVMKLDSGNSGQKETDQARDDRLKFTKAYLLKTFYNKFRSNTDYSNKDEGTAINWALADIQKIKQELLSFGLNKAGTIRPELKTLAEHYMGKDMGNVAIAGSQVDAGPRIEIRGTFVPGSDSNILKKLKIRAHTVILYTDEIGQQFYISSGSSLDRKLVSNMGKFEPGVVGWEPNGYVKVLEQNGKATAQKWDKAKQAAKKIEQDNYRYNLLWRNCNVASYNILKEAGVNVPPFLGGAYWGWGLPLKK